MNHIKTLWGHYLALLILVAILFFPVRGVYKFFHFSFGSEAAVIALTITVMGVVILGVRGAVYTHALIRDLRREFPTPNPQVETNPPLIFKIFKIELGRPERLETGTRNHSVETDPPLYHFPSFPRKRRGKQPRFPEEKIRKAVLRWESRDPSFSVLTLEEFLAQEFGSGPDGILLMATTTFYDWRRRILKEIEAQEHQP